MNQKFTIKGVGEITLSNKDYLDSGGEADIYAKGGMAYKIYKDATKMLPVAKIQELSVLTHPNIIKPQQLLLDKKNKPIGYSMRLVKGVALCQLFTKAFRQRNNIDNDQIVELVKTLYSMVDYIHQQGVLVVDLNEMNFLVNSVFKEIYAIDVNSYQTSSFPATVIMDTVRDRHCNNVFNKETDWFSWGILTFQMLVGIHPYKGNHPDTQNIARDEWLNHRMLNDISVFNKDATMPKICQSFDVIPSALRQWYKAVFEDGKRIAPPKDFQSAIQLIATIKNIIGGHLFDIMEIESFTSDILSYYYYEGDRLVLTDKTANINGRQYSVPCNDCKFTFTPKLMRPIAVYLEGEIVRVFDILNQVQLPFVCNGDALTQCDNRIYIQNGMNILELEFIEGKNLQCYANAVTDVLDMPNATKVFDGVIMQNLMGRFFASIFPASGYCYQIGIPELDHNKIVDAKYEKNVLVVIVARRSGEYDRYVFRFNSDYQKYDLRKVENITYTGLNFTVNDIDVCTLHEEEKLEAFSNKKDAGTVKVLDDPALESDMRLYHDGTKIMFTRGNKLHSIAMRKSIP